MNCKQGDLAIIVRASDPENLGKIVEVVRPAVANELFISVDGKRCRTTGSINWTASWVIRSHGSPLMWSSPDGRKGLFHERALRDDYMRPIPRIPDEQTIDTTEPIKEIA